MIIITAKTKELFQTLKYLKVAVGRSKKNNNVFCEITVTDGKLTFAVPGAIFPMVCITQGTCKTAVLFLHFFQIVKDLKVKDVKIIITKDSIQIQNVTISANSTFFENDKILRTIQLPMNYNDADLLKLLNEGYTMEELEFNNLTFKIYQAEINHFIKGKGIPITKPKNFLTNPSLFPDSF
jgi:hypothetical protein